MVNGTMRFSVDLFKRLYQPLLEELEMPYMLIYDLWGFSLWVPGGTPVAIFDRLYWDELSLMHRSLGIHTHTDSNDDDNNNHHIRDNNNHHIRIHEYTDNRSPESFRFAVYLYEGGYTPGVPDEGAYTPGVADVHPRRPRWFRRDVGDVCAQALRLSLLMAMGNPGGTGTNPKP